MDAYATIKLEGDHSFHAFFTAVAVATAQLVSAAVDIKALNQLTKSKLPFVENTFVVELNSDSNIKRGFASPHEELYHDLRRRGANPTWRVKSEYKSDIMTGLTIQLGSSEDLVKLAQAKGVESITPVYRHSRHRPVGRQVLTNPAAHPREAASSIYEMTGVDKAHAAGYFGEGITIGVIDDGVDYTLSALGGKFGPGNTIIGGYDFVGDNYTGYYDGPPPVEDPDPFTQCGDHGTHVTGITAAAPGNPYNITGVAYKSKFNVYRVLSCSGDTSDEFIISALLRAYADKNDIITLSLRSKLGWADASWVRVATRIANKGRIITTALGNSGQYGAWLPDSPSTSPGVIKVASADGPIAQIQNAKLSNGRLIPYQQLTPLHWPDNLPLFAISSDVNIPDDACNALPSSTPDLSKYAVIIRRGSCHLTDKMDNAAAFGAKYFVLYDNRDEPLMADEYDYDYGNYIPMFISQQDGIFLVQQAIPQKMTLSFPNLPTTAPMPRSGLISLWSSYGPSNDMHLGPSVAAPGAWIISTVPKALSGGSGFAAFSGTSMATPFVAGAAALFLQAHGKKPSTALAARSIFQNTAVPVKETKAPGALLDTAAHQGSGVIQVFDAIKSTASMLPAELLLNDTAYFKGAHKLHIRNRGRQTVTYTLSHVPAGTAKTFSGDEARGDVQLVSNFATVKIFPPKLTIPPGWTLEVNVWFTPPTGISPSEYPVYSGYIQATGSDKSVLRSTYMGVAAKLKDKKILATSVPDFDLALPALIAPDGHAVASNETLVCNLNSTDWPRVSYRLVGGTRVLRFDLIDSNARVHTQRPNRRDLSELDAPFSEPGPPIGGNIWDWLLPSSMRSSSRTFASVKILGALYEENDVGRGIGDFVPNDSTIGFDRFGNGTSIPDGSYRILFRALKVTGNRDREEDYEAWTSPVLVVKRS